MASLKDMRVRITATKATQKITKAMQMVAAAKLRRAQSAAEAARPYASRMAQVLGNLAGGLVAGPETPRLLAILRSEHKGLLDSIREEGQLTDPIRADLKAALDRYAKNFA